MINKVSVNNRGFALVFTILLTLLIALITGSFTTTAINDLLLANRIANNIRAYYAADAGIADAMIRLRAFDPPPASFAIGQTNVPLSNGKLGCYSAQINLVAAGGGFFNTYDIVSTGNYPVSGGAARTLTLRVTVTSITQWGYLSNTEHHPVWGDLWFITGMVIDGPIHTNGQFNISGTPVFTGTASSVASSIRYYRPGTDDPDFQQGVFLGAPSVSLPTQTDMLNNIEATALDGGLYLSGGNAVIALQADGTITVTAPLDPSGLYTTPTNIAMPANGAIYVDGGNATVHGNLNGNLTIGTSNDIWIDGAILYHDKTGTDYAGNDLLGLVAFNNITVSAGAPNNIEIDAYLVGINGSFQVDRFNNYVIKGDMVQFGGLCNFLDGPTGMFNPRTNRIVSGYNQILQYDTRMGNTVAPLIPVGFPPARDTNNRIAYRKVMFSEN